MVSAAALKGQASPNPAQRMQGSTRPVPYKLIALFEIPISVAGLKVRLWHVQIYCWQG
jgi:hypothetical protein